MNDEPKVDLCFRIVGSRLAVDHGFALYGALSDAFPMLHETQDIGVKLIRGRYAGSGVLDISPHSALVLRMPADRIGQCVALAGKTLEILGESLTIGAPQARPLIPAVALYAQVATTKNGDAPLRFETEARAQMRKIGVEAKLTIGKRRTFAVHGKQVVGYSVLVTELDAEESIALQEHGIGGRRKMGCGFFEVWKG
jgi:CRISPR-associated protein Cas6